MSSATNIEWTDVTDNVIVAVDAKGKQRGWWCRKISPGCAICYAETINDSDYFKGNHLKYAGSPPTLKLREDIIDKWARQKKRRKHFVMSMSDVFGDWVPRSWIFRILDGMCAAPRQIFQVLTKRADIMRREVFAWLEARGLNKVPSNIWLGVTVENQEYANLRIPDLLAIPAIRFLSCEPLIGPVSIPEVCRKMAGPCWCGVHVSAIGEFGAEAPKRVPWPIHQVIIGGESDRRRRVKVRPMHPEWALSLLDQAERGGAARFFKQWGDYGPAYSDDMKSPRGLQYGTGDDPDGGYTLMALPDGTMTDEEWNGGSGPHLKHARPMIRVGKKRAGRILRGREWSEFPEDVAA